MISRATSRPLGGPPVMPKWPCPSTKVQAGPPRHVTQDGQSVGRGRAESHPVAHLRAGQRGEHAAGVLDEEVQQRFAQFGGASRPEISTTCAATCNPVASRGCPRSPRLDGDLGSVGITSGANMHGVIAAFGFQRDLDAQRIEQPRGPGEQPVKPSRVSEEAQLWVTLVHDHPAAAT